MKTVGISKLAQDKSLSWKKNPQGVIQQDQIIPFPERLKEAIGDNSIRSLAIKCNLDPKTLRNYLSGKQYPTLDRLAAIADASGKSINWLATGENKESTVSIVQEIKGNVTVPEYDIRAAAGAGSFIEQEVKIGEFSFPETWLRERMLYGYSLCVIKAWGESMEPTINHQDSMLVKLLDTSEKAAYDGVYVLRLDGMLLVKRMKYDMSTQGHHIISDNELYSSTFVPNSDFDERIKVVGSVAGIIFRRVGAAK